MNDALSPGVVLSCLGVDLEVDRALARQCRHLARSTRRPIASVTGHGVAGLAALTAAAVAHTDLLAVHACVAVGGDGLVAVPGPSAMGKSTLSLALLQQGFHHVSDEALALDRGTGEVVPFARPVCVDLTSWNLLRLGVPAPRPDEEALVDPADFGAVAASGGRVSDLVIATRTDAPAAIEPTTPGVALAALIPRCFNHHRGPASSLQTLAGVVQHARLWRATYRDARTFSADLGQLLGIPA